LSNFKLTYKRFSEQSILVEWPQDISEITLDDVLGFKKAIKKSNAKEVLQINSAYNSILINYTYTIDNFNDEILTLKHIYSAKVNLEKGIFKLWKIPVCYDDEFALDIDLISEAQKCNKTEIIQRHSEVLYTVYFIGFLPGFLYLGGLDERLNFPRKETPRLHIEKGAVAIGGNQTGVYPNESPGGWNVIGNAPVTFFDVSKEIPCFAMAGDKIQFVPITLKQHKDISALAKAGVYQLESEVLDG
jgi:inhibitor of KinA